MSVANYFQLPDTNSNEMHRIKGSTIIIRQHKTFKSLVLEELKG